MKKTSLLYLLLILLILTGCSNEVSTTGVVNDDETFVIGIDENYPPLGFKDDEGNIVGFDIDLAQATADQLGMDLAIVPIEWTNKEEELASGNIDAIWSGFTITPEREEEFLFTDPYLDVQPVVVVRGDSTISSVDDLVDKVVGVQEGSYAYNLLQSLPIYSEIDHETLFEENVSALKNLYVGLTDAVIVDSSVANWFINEQEVDYKIVDTLGNFDLGVAFAKNNIQLRDQVNLALNTLKRNGTAEAISVEWFGNDMTE